MNRKEYDSFTAAFTSFMEREELTNLSPTDQQWETFFTWRPCECCGRPQGGDRVECSGWSSTKKDIMGPYDVCADCVHYAEYGQLDDLTMLDLG